MKAISAADFSGRFIHYGIREHGMAAAMNGMALHGGIIPYSGTFLVFSDYCRPAIRLAALMGERVIHVMTHDSIGLGEDGPTHQPVEHLAALRAIPNLLRVPSLRRGRDRRVLAAGARSQGQAERAGADAPEPAAAAQPARRATTSARTAPTRSAGPDGAARRVALRHRLGGRDRGRRRKAAGQRGIAARVVSVPCFELFLAQPARLPPRRSSATHAVKVAVEAAVRQGWDAIIGSDGIFVGMTALRRQRALQGTLQAFRHYRRSGRAKRR